MQPDFVRRNISPMLEAMREAVAARPEHARQLGFSIGCGDSYCAALAARSFMMDATRRMIEPVESLEFSRYLVVLHSRRRVRLRRLQFGNGVAHHRGRAACAGARRLDLRRDGQRDESPR